MSNLAIEVLWTLRQYISEQECLKQDNQALLDTFCAFFQLKKSTESQNSIESSALNSMSFTLIQLLQCVASVLATKRASGEAYKEYFSSIYTLMIKTSEQQVPIYIYLIYLTDFALCIFKIRKIDQFLRFKMYKVLFK